LKSPLFKNINNTPSKEGVRINRRVVTFIFCLIVSAFFWVMMSLSKEYSIEIKFPVSYINFPIDKVISNQLPTTIDIEIKSTGFNLLVYKIKQKRDTVFIDAKDSKHLPKKNNFYILPNARIDKIASQFNNNIRIMKIYPDTIFLNYNKKKSKQVSVKANIKVDFANQYQQSDSIQLTPNFITVSGASELVDKINFIETKTIKLKKVSDTISIQLQIIKTPNLKLVDLSQLTVKAKINVTKYTEASIELPIEVENLPSGFTLKTFPDKITVKYNVAFKKYESITTHQFKAIVDYSKIELKNNKLKIELVKFPSDIRAIKISPEKVEYIIRK
jgi:hypothetical protein